MGFHKRTTGIFCKRNARGKGTLTNIRFKFTLTINGFDSVGHVQFETGCQCSEECCGVVGALEAFSGLLEALTVVHLQVNNRAVERKIQVDIFSTAFPQWMLSLKVVREVSCLPFDLQVIQLPPGACAPSSHTIQAFLYPNQHPPRGV